MPGWMRCPTCRRMFEAALSPVKPFCSPRCKQVDLARWLGEFYSVPVMRREDDEESPEGTDPAAE